MEEYIPIEELVENGIYEVNARNFSFALHQNCRFYGIRYKWEDEFISYEIHWDKDGTVKPKRFIGPYNDSFDYGNRDDRIALMDFLEIMEAFEYENTKECF